MAILSVLHYILIAIYPFNLTCDDFQMIWQWNLWILDQYGTTAKCSLIQMPAIKRFPLKIKVDLPGIYYCLLFYIIVYYFSPLCYFYRLLLLFAVFHCHCYQQTLGSYRKDFRVPVDTVTRATLVASELIPLSKSWESDILLRFTAASMLSPRSVSLQSIQLRSSLSAEYRLHEDAKALDWIINKLWEIYSTVDVKMKKWLNYLNFVCSKKRIFMRMYHCLVFFRDVWANER